MSAVSKNLLISFFVRSVVPVVAETMLKTAGLIHQKVMRKFLSSLSAGTVPGIWLCHLQVKRKGPNRSLDLLDIGGVIYEQHHDWTL